MLVKIQLEFISSACLALALLACGETGGKKFNVPRGEQLLYVGERVREIPSKGKSFFLTFAVPKKNRHEKF